VWRHDFEPAKLIAGVVLLSGAVLGGLEAYDRTGDLPDWLLLAVVPGGLVLAATVAAGSYATRRARQRAAEAASGPVPELGGMPMEELREEQERRFGSGAK
jgi:hypothetical protein